MHELKNKDMDCSEEINYDNWSSAELADALINNNEFLNENVKEGNEDNVINWDRCDLISYAYDYLT